MHRLAWPLRFVAVILAGALLTTGVVLAVAPRLWMIANAHEELPVVLPEFQPLSQRTIVYDLYDNVIDVYERENSQPIRLDQVPTEVIDALLAVEDNEYYLHHGVNLRGFFRALLSNFASDAPVQGASTITQQVVKNEFLAGLPRDGRYKALQAHYATMLEKKLTKDEILERYLNTVYFGNNAYGLQAAAEVYFGKNAGELTMVQGAFLAGLVRSPSGYDPIRNLEQSQRRFVQVVDRLEKVGLITEREGADLADTWELPDRLRTIPTFSTTPTYYTLALRDYLLTKSNILGATEQERATLLYRGGLRIHTTFDPTLQAQAEQARNILPNSAIGFDASVVALDTTTGAIRAMVGGRGLRSDVPAGEVNMALAPRQTGSSIKAFILATAHQAGAQPNDIINGTAPCAVPDFVDGRETLKFIRGGGIEIGPLNGRNTWSSTDCGFIRLGYSVGLHRVVDSVYRMAHSTYFYQGQPEDEHESVPAAGRHRHRQQRDVAARHGNRHADHHQSGPAPRPVLRGVHRAGRRRPLLLAPGCGHPGARSGRRERNSAHAEGCHPIGHGRSQPAQLLAAGHRQDRHAGRQHQRMVRGRHATDHHGRVGGRSQRADADEPHSRVRCRDGSQRQGAGC
ncbi:MAG: transglycosylase domain-containing protein [Acidimicrobiaceae bacterium]|nr:transglycosylase domain-containing protein [Acidimicrobiaceae bacterium]